MYLKQVVVGLTMPHACWCYRMLEENHLHVFLLFLPLHLLEQQSSLRLQEAPSPLHVAHY